MPDIRSEFPILSTRVKSNPLVYFDNAASTQKPQVVLDALQQYYTTQNSNIHRGAHYLANLATEAYEAAREKVAQYIHAQDHEVIFTSGTTHSINMLMQSWARKMLQAGDEIIVTEMEHHANIVPWLFLQSELGIKLRYIPMGENCTLDIAHVESLFTSKTKLVSIAYISNAIGTIHPIETIIQIANKHHVPIHLDAAQAIQHTPIDVQKLGVDFMSFSGHKIYAPMGVGVFWGKEEHLNAMSPYHYGGEMIHEVFLDRFTVNKLPFKMEAGTPNVAGVIGLGAAIDYIQSLGWEEIETKEKKLHQYFLQEIRKIENITLYTPETSASVVSFNVKNIHAYDIGMLLDSKGIAIRTGHHCCQPLMRKLGVEGTCRASLAFYNTQEEVDYFIGNFKNSLLILK